MNDDNMSSTEEVAPPLPLSSLLQAFPEDDMTQLLNPVVSAPVPLHFAPLHFRSPAAVIQPEVVCRAVSCLFTWMTPQPRPVLQAIFL